MLARAAARRAFSAAPPKLDRAARRAARDGSASPGAADASTTTALWASVGATTAALSAGIYSLMADPRESAVARAVQSSGPGKWLVANVAAAADPFVAPVREKLLPDWPPDYLNIGPDVPCPHTLVLDLDDTRAARARNRLSPKRRRDAREGARGTVRTRRRRDGPAAAARRRRGAVTP